MGIGSKASRHSLNEEGYFNTHRLGELTVNGVPKSAFTLPPRPQVKEEYPVLDDKDRKIIELQEDLRLAEHRAFAAEVQERRANQKRRNQRKELKRIHAAINEKNNRIRNLEMELSVEQMLKFRA